MTIYRVHDHDTGVHLVTGADTYAPEGPLTTFFATRRASGVVDSWATRIASFRTTNLIMISQVHEVPPSSDHGTYAPVNAKVHRPIESAPAAA